MADAGVFVRRLLQVGVLTKDTHRNTIRLAPPLIINESQVDGAVDRLAEVLAASSPVQAEPRRGSLRARARSREVETALRKDHAQTEG